jgi:putative oxidoreductase
LFTRASGAALAAWCLITAALFHSNFADHNMMIHFLKNVAMAGGLLYVAAFGGGALSLDAVLFRRTIGERAVA